MQASLYLQLPGAVFSLDSVYVVTGLVLWIFAAMSFRDRANKRRAGSGLFWLILGVIFVFGGVLPHWLTGLLVLAMVAIDGIGRVAARPLRRIDERRTGGARARLGNRIFIPVLAIPL